jgi:hypothetical protein
VLEFIGKEVNKMLFLIMGVLSQGIFIKIVLEEDI